MTHLRPDQHTAARARHHRRAQRPALGSAGKGRLRLRPARAHRQRCLPGSRHPHRPAAASRGWCRRAVLVGVRAGDAVGRRGSHRDAGADRRRPRHDQPVRRPAGPRHHGGGRGAGMEAGEGRQPDGCRGRPPDQRVAGHTANAAPPRCPLPDPHAQRQRPVGRLRHGRASAGRALRLRSRGGCRDEPHRDARRPQPRQRRRDAACTRRLERAGDLLALLRPRGVRPPAQRPRRRAGPAGRERRRLHGHLRAQVREPGSVRLDRGGQGGRSRRGDPHRRRGRRGRLPRALPPRTPRAGRHAGRRGHPRRARARGRRRSSTSGWAATTTGSASCRPGSRT